MTQPLALLDTSIQFVKGVGPKLGAIFNRHGILTVRDLLFLFPRRYEDRSQIQKIQGLEAGVKVTLSLRVINQRKFFVAKLRKTCLDVRCEDETGAIQLKWFHPPWGIDKKLVAGCSLIATGKTQFFRDLPEMIHPEISWGGIEAETAHPLSDLHVGRIVPVYPDLEGISGRVLRKVLWEALEQFASLLEEEVPSYLLDKRKLPGIESALTSLHFPSENLESSELRVARARFAYEEFLKFQYVILRRRLNLEKQNSYVVGDIGRASCLVLKSQLPFSLTSGQEECLNEILGDLTRSHSMNRLLQGEVGSGKTVLAFLSAAAVIAEGGQVALMAPTEILAVQHLKTIEKLFLGQISAELLTGRTSAAERKRIFSRLAEGLPLVLIGTHALIEDPVCFKSLRLVIIDEQHRFGVEQRRSLSRKGESLFSHSGKKFYPHILLLSATPIPRTLALSVFGDLALSTLTELPPGRSPVKTQVIKSVSEQKKIYEFINEQLREGRQAYFIYPLVNESEAEGFTHLKSAVDESVRLAKEVFPDVSVGLLHGQLSSEEKNTVMEHFKSGGHQVLVSTTVVEVGVDVPNATVMVIEHAERFGLSQLHQLRGRVGRGKFHSTCYLFSNSQANSRLEVLEETQDGFKIAEADLELRGPGEFIGTRQAGDLPFKMANIVQDKLLLSSAREDAHQMMLEDSELILEKNERFLKYFKSKGQLQLDRLGTS